MFSQNLFKEEDSTFSITLPSLQYGPIKTEAGYIQAVLRDAVDGSARLLGQVKTSPRIKEPVFEHSSGEKVIITNRKHTPYLMKLMAFS